MRQMDLPAAPDMKSGCFFNNQICMPRGVHQSAVGFGMVNAKADSQVLGSAYRKMWKLPPYHSKPEISTGHHHQSQSTGDYL
ncbi:hypothetical protein M495_14540 [Serratia liquefaciens ATCC 27592]|nr:hypothetical protein M495_14540 [Serratia liquefaciens ATCC 27592]